MRTLALLLPLVWSSVLAAQSSCLTLSHQKAEIALHIRNQLRTVQTGSDHNDTEVPREAQLLLPRFKAALVETATYAVPCHLAEDPPAQLQAELAKLLEANAPQPPNDTVVSNNDPRYPEWQAFTYGHNLLVAVSKPQTNFLTVTFTFHIDCGDDTVWLVFERSDERWRKVLDWQARPYKQIRGAFGDFFLSGFVQTPQGWRAVVAHGKPWCSSRMSSFALDVLAPSANPSRPALVWHTEREYSRGDYKVRMHASGDQFELRLGVSAIDLEEFERTAIYHYAVKADGVRRMQPMALNGRDFVEEWLASPWSEAMTQMVTPGTSSLRVAHDRYSRHEPENNMSYTDRQHGPVLACTPKMFQVEIAATRETIVPGKPGGDSRPLSPWFFHIRETGNGYQMVDVTTKPSPSCGGTDLVPISK